MSVLYLCDFHILCPIDAIDVFSDPMSCSLFGILCIVLICFQVCVNLFFMLFVLCYFHGSFISKAILIQSMCFQMRALGAFVDDQ